MQLPYLAQDETANLAATLLIAAIYAALLALNLWAFLIRPTRPWSEKFGMLLQIVGLYTFGFGLIIQTKIFPSELFEELSSPDLLVFYAGNSTAVSLGSAAMSMALDPDKISHDAFAFLQLGASLLLSVLGVAYFLLYVFVVVPLSYVAYVLVSLPVSAITTAATDFRFLFDGETTSISKVVSDNSVIIKNYLIAFCSLALKMSLEFLTWFRKARRAKEKQQPNEPPWRARHPRVASAALLARQLVLGVLLVAFTVYALLLPSMVRDDKGTDAPIGETIGAEIVMALALWAFVVLFVRARRQRTMITNLYLASGTGTPTT